MIPGGLRRAAVPVLSLSQPVIRHCISLHYKNNFFRFGRPRHPVRRILGRSEPGVDDLQRAEGLVAVVGTSVAAGSLISPIGRPRGGPSTAAKTATMSTWLRTTYRAPDELQPVAGPYELAAGADPGRVAGPGSP